MARVHGNLAPLLSYWAEMASFRPPRLEDIDPIRIARTHRDPEVRKQAVFWLGQSNDPRAIALFEELLTKR